MRSVISLMPSVRAAAPLFVCPALWLNLDPDPVHVWSILPMIADAKMQSRQHRLAPAIRLRLACDSRTERSEQMQTMAGTNQRRAARPRPPVGQRDRYLTSFCLFRLLCGLISCAVLRISAAVRPSILRGDAGSRAADHDDRDGAHTQLVSIGDGMRRRLNMGGTHDSSENNDSVQ